MRLTRGTETSQYPEEKKENSISLVVASEPEIAQTVGHVPAGLWGHRHELQNDWLEESDGKRSRRG